ncbi:MAG: DsrE/DsrF/DrsH-like family protein [Sulfobacillus thermotolerans]|nr:DsrE/DsrF/DrsH-like family protein [Sulfobacillus thermotolerans]
MKKVAIISSAGDIEGAYKTLNVANAAAAMDAEVSVFCTFGGLQMLMKDPQYPLSPGMEPFKERAATLPSIKELREMAMDMGVKFIACQMTMDLMGIGPEQLMDDIVTAGAATFMEDALDADSTVTF